MNNITFAVYQGKEYPAGIKKDGKIVLRSLNPDESKSGFTEKRNGQEMIYVKYVTRLDISEIFDRRKKALYSGYEFEVVEEKEEEISIVTMTGDYRVWEGMGMKLIDKGVYQKWIPRNEAELIIEKTPL